jgi:VIT1/CCC1 family predicted Fe2+/Mn2+ transporter
LTHLSKFSFGATSAVITSLAFIVGLSNNPEPRLAIIGSLMVFAIADNISDSLGIHIYQESDLKKSSTVAISTFTNFFTRLLVIGAFAFLVSILPIFYAVVASIILGMSLLITLSYLIAKEQGVDPYMAILQHLAVAIIVVVGSFLMREWITSVFAGV